MSRDLSQHTGVKEYFNTGEAHDGKNELVSGMIPPVAGSYFPAVSAFPVAMSLWGVVFGAVGWVDPYSKDQMRDFRLLRRGHR